jgi:hypothetical protein
MMWGDMFLAKDECVDACNAPSKAEAKRCRDGLPKDIMITDWHYADADASKFESAWTLKNEGFESIASTWYLPQNIAGFSKAAKETNSFGLLQTTWAGYNGNISQLEKEFKQFSAMVLAAEYAWNSGNTKVEELPYRAEDAFQDEWDQVAKDETPQKGFTIDLSSLYNEKLADNNSKTGWTGNGPDYDLSNAPTKIQRLKGDLYQFAGSTKDNSVIRLATQLESRTAYPEKVTIPINRNAGSLLFIQTCAWAGTPGKTVGAYDVHYADGTSKTINLIYANNIASWTDLNQYENTPSVWKDTTKSGQATVLREMEWTNPYPEKQITSIDFRTTSVEAGPALLAISGIDPNN